MRIVRSMLLPGLLAAAFATATPAQSALLIAIDKSTQTMTVTRDGEQLHVWPVSTGRGSYATPSGRFTPFRLEVDHYSKEWDDAPMPHSIFFTERGHAIHGTFDAARLGTPASHGCVRLSTRNAAQLFAMVKQEGLGNTRVVLSGETPRASAPAVARRAPRNDDRAPARTTRAAPREDDRTTVYTYRSAPREAYLYERQPTPQRAPHPYYYRDYRPYYYYAPAPQPYFARPGYYVR